MFKQSKHIFLWTILCLTILWLIIGIIFSALGGYYFNENNSIASKNPFWFLSNDLNSILESSEKSFFIIFCKIGSVFLVFLTPIFAFLFLVSWIIYASITFKRINLHLSGEQTNILSSSMEIMNSVKAQPKINREIKDDINQIKEYLLKNKDKIEAVKLYNKPDNKVETVINPTYDTERGTFNYTNTKSRYEQTTSSSVDSDSRQDLKTNNAGGSQSDKTNIDDTQNQNWFYKVNEWIRYENQIWLIIDISRVFVSNMWMYNLKLKNKVNNQERNIILKSITKK